MAVFNPGETANSHLRFKLVDRGSKIGPTPRYVVELYTFYPEVGPVGTDGRGPYCIRWVPVRSGDLKRVKAELATRNIPPLP